MEWNTQIIIRNVKNKITVNLCLILHRVSSKITIFVSLMYRGSTLLYTQEVLVDTKRITRIKIKGEEL